MGEEVLAINSQLIRVSGRSVRSGQRFELNAIFVEKLEGFNGITIPRCPIEAPLTQCSGPVRLGEGFKAKLNQC